MNTITLAIVGTAAGVAFGVLVFVALSFLRVQDRALLRFKRSTRMPRRIREAN